ncbi:MAG: O-antigen ligase family protein [candidate division WOR-3 bacterium]
MKTLNSSVTTSPTRENIKKLITALALLFPFLPNAYRSSFLIISIVLGLILSPEIFLKKENLPIYLLWVVAVLTSIFSLNPLKAIVNTKGIIFDILVPFAVFGFLPFIDRELILKYIPYVALFFATLTLIVFFVFPQGFHIFNRDGGLVGFVGGKLTYGGVISFLIPLLHFAEGKKKNTLVFFSIFALLLNLTYNLSRSYYLGVMAFLLICIVMIRKTLKIYYGALTLLFLLSIITNQRSMKYLKTSPPTEQNASSFARIEMWKLGAKILKEKPLTGLGYELWSLPKVHEEYIEKYKTTGLEKMLKLKGIAKAIRGHLHSNYVMAGVNGGLPLLITFIFFLYYYSLYFARSPLPWKAIGLGLMAIFLISGAFEYNFSDAEAVQNFSMTLGVLISMTKKHESSSQSA